MNVAKEDRTERENNIPERTVTGAENCWGDVFSSLDADGVFKGFGHLLESILALL